MLNYPYNLLANSVHYGIIKIVSNGRYDESGNN